MSQPTDPMARIEELEAQVMELTDTLASNFELVSTETLVRALMFRYSCFFAIGHKTTVPSADGEVVEKGVIGGPWRKGHPFEVLGLLAAAWMRHAHEIGSMIGGMMILSQDPGTDADATEQG